MRYLLVILVFTSNSLLAQERVGWDKLFKTYEYFPLGDFPLNDLDSQLYIMDARLYSLFEEDNFVETPPNDGTILRVLGTPTHSEPFLLNFKLNSNELEIIVKQADYKDLGLDDFDKTKFSRREWKDLKRNIDYYNFETIPLELKEKSFNDSIKFEFTTSIHTLELEQFKELNTLITDSDSFTSLSESRSTASINNLKETGTITTYCVGVSFFIDLYQSNGNYISTVTHDISNELNNWIDSLVYEMINDGTLSELNKSW